MRGWGFREMPKHPLLWPVYAICIADLCWLSFHIVRTSLYNPDIVWDHKNNPEPWQDHRDKRYRLWAGNYDYSKRPCLAPIIKDGQVIPVEKPKE
ncbi:cytochrome c oxidase subunit NDUFA4-like [Toxorhynchites rutilus septentrionalis]|uniref:cytochrome c oxidase subunit NDUFA4-like n=1 Tax=Toxorhynchites rutilus septentrionalis TaxID=329112 RepID=UPI00247A782D|nr:cytochrome c oxidase subunit NDUFA4-like [Toxorhynchites rutilus septentrionalis]